MHINVVEWQVTEGQGWRQSAADVSIGPVSELLVHIRVGTVTILCPGKLGSLSIEPNVFKLPINPLLRLVWQVFAHVPVLNPCQHRVVQLLIESKGTIAGSRRWMLIEIPRNASNCIGTILRFQDLMGIPCSYEVLEFPPDDIKVNTQKRNGIGKVILDVETSRSKSIEICLRCKSASS